MLHKKCAHRGVTFASLEDFFTAELVAEAEVHWDSSLMPFVAEVPECQTVLDGLTTLLQRLLPRGV